MNIRLVLPASVGTLVLLEPNRLYRTTIAETLRSFWEKNVRSVPVMEFADWDSFYKLAGRLGILRRNCYVVITTSNVDRQHGNTPEILFRVFSRSSREPTSMKRVTIPLVLHHAPTARVKDCGKKQLRKTAERKAAFVTDELKKAVGLEA